MGRKYEKGAAFERPLAPMVETKAMGRGTIEPIIQR
jgi:hypothetical protein